MLAPWLILASPCSAPASRPARPASSPPRAEPNVPALYRLPAATYRFEREPVLDEPKFTVSKVRFPSPIVTRIEVNNTVHAEYFQPKGAGKRPAVVVLHILGADFALSRYYAARLASEGVAALLHEAAVLRRTPPARPSQALPVERHRRDQPGDAAGGLRRPAGRVVAAERPEVDPARVGVTGISLGGITSALVLAVDPAFERSVTILAGGNLDEILWTMDEAGADRWRREWLAAGRTTADLKALTTTSTRSPTPTGSGGRSS